MTSFAILLIIVGIFVLINASSFRDVIFGTKEFNFTNPKSVG